MKVFNKIIAILTIATVLFVSACAEEDLNLSGSDNPVSVQSESPQTSPMDSSSSGGDTEPEVRTQYDVVVYGDTPAAVISAVAASRQGVDVALVAPNKQLGGMMSGGLSQTDLGNSSVIGGMSREFFSRNAKKRGLTSSVSWYFEPHVAEEIFNDMLEETKSTAHAVDVFKGERLKETNGVEMRGVTIEKIICESGKTFEATQFIDASYEGDLMAQAGVSYTYGREGREEYGESLAGVVSTATQNANNHNFKYKIKARDDEGNLLYREVSEEPLAEVGSGDKKIQAYNFRMVLTNDESNKIPFPKPEGYDRERYKLLGVYLNLWKQQTGKAPTAHELFGFRDGVNNKWDFNNKGAFSTDFIGGNYNYPDATYAEREQIWQEHYLYTAGLFYYLANDEYVPAETRNEIASYGLCKDEYTETGNWTFQLYVREGRRMLGEYVMTQKDIQKDGGVALLKDDTIGMGSYNSDSHNVQRYITEDGYVCNEGNMEVKVDPYEIPYRALLPKKEEVDNLIVSCTISASHVAYSTVRMEPQYMIMGQAAGTAAAIAVNDGKKVHKINVTKLQSILKQSGAVLSLNERPADNQPVVYGENTVMFDSFDDYSSGWTKQNYSSSGAAVTITQGDSYVNLKRSPDKNYGFMVKKNFVAPKGDFYYGFKAKINAEGKVELTVRSAEYLVEVILVRGTGSEGYAQDNYISPNKQFALDTSVWHDYQVVVKKGENNAYTYDLYVDGALAWENASYTSGFGNDIVKIGVTGESVSGKNVVLDMDLDYFVIETGAKPEYATVLSGIFKDETGNKISCIEDVPSSLKTNFCGYIANYTGSLQKVKIVAEIYRNGVLVPAYSVEKTFDIENGTIGDCDLDFNIPTDRNGVEVRIKVLYGENFSQTLKEDIELY